MDDDRDRPSPRAPSRPSSRGSDDAGEPGGAVVKWFNSSKGFGFVELLDGSGDAFLHIRTVEAAGLSELAAGTSLRVQVGQGTRGRQINAIVEVEAAGGSTQPQRRSSAAAPARTARADAHPELGTSVVGTVMRFNPDKGFGFVNLEDGGNNIFVHISVVKRAGLDGLMEGQRVAVKVVMTQKGREAESIELLE